MNGLQEIFPFARKAFSELPDRLQDKIIIEPNSGCWLWTAALDRRGYGRTARARPDRQQVGAYKMVYETLVKEVPEGLELHHRCETPCCCNPDHLEPVTHAVNCRLSKRIGRHHNRKRGHQSFCKRGHAMKGYNVIVSKDGVWRCRKCHNLLIAGYRYQKRHQLKLALAPLT